MNKHSVGLILITTSIALALASGAPVRAPKGFFGWKPGLAAGAP